MMEFIKKAVLAGVGAASLTAEKMDELTRELVKKGEMTEAEGRQFIDEMQNRARESKDLVKKQIETTVEKTLAKMNLAQADDIKNMQQEIALLRAELQELKKQEKQTS